MRWGRLIKDVEYWFDSKIIPILGPGDKISMAKVKEEYKEFKDAVKAWDRAVENPSAAVITDHETFYESQNIRVAKQHVEAEAADLFIALVCYCHANDINLKRAVYATYLKLQKRKWKKTAPGLVRHVGKD